MIACVTLVAPASLWDASDAIVILPRLAIERLHILASRSPNSDDYSLDSLHCRISRSHDTDADARIDRSSTRARCVAWRERAEYIIRKA